MATRYDAMCIGLPEWIHIGMECGELMGEKDGKAVYRFQDGYIEEYSMKEVTDFMDGRIECFRDGIEEALRTFCIADVVGFIYDLYQEGYIEEYEENALYGIADPDELCNTPGEYWEAWTDEEYGDENPLVRMLDL